MRRLVPLLFLAAAASGSAAPPNAGKKPVLTAQQQAAAKAKAAAARRAQAGKSGLTPLGARGTSPMALPKGNGPDRIGEPFLGKKQPGSELPAARAMGTALPMRTAAEYDPRIDAKPDVAVVRAAGESWEQIDRAQQSWKLAGAGTFRWLNLAADPLAFHSGGKADGTPHPEEVDLGPGETPLTEGDGPAVLPTPSWLAHIKEHLRRGAASGAEGFWLSCPGYRGDGGFSQFFRGAWKDANGQDWEAPTAPGLFFKTSRVRSDLGLNAVNEILRQTRDYAKEAGRPLQLHLVLDSPLDLAARGRVFPEAAVSRLPIDGIVGQVSLSNARRPLTYEGRRAAAPFERSFLSFSYFANLLDGLQDRALTFSVTNDESAADDGTLYRQALSASLFFPQGRGLETCSRPETALLPKDGATPPPFAVTGLLNLATALREIPSEGADWAGAGTRGIGVLTLDSMTWASGGPRGSSTHTIEGLALPLLKRGVPVQLVPAERVADANFLSRYRVLLLSFDGQKPPGPEVSQGLVQWARAGGTLVLFGGEDAYDKIGEWWEKSGFATPADHFLRQAGPAVDLLQRSTRGAGGGFTPLVSADGSQGRKVYTLALGERAEPGKPVFLRFSDLTPENGAGARVRRVRVLEGDRVRADFTAGSAGERPFLVESSGSRADRESRSADGAGAFLYRFQNLKRESRVEVEMEGAFQISTAASADPGTSLRALNPLLPAIRLASSYPLTSYPLTGAQALYAAGEGTQEIDPVWASALDRGTLVYSGIPAEFGADSASGADFIRGLVRYACGRAGLEYAEGPLIMRRGAYVIAHSVGRTTNLEGLYLDLSKPEVPLVRDPALPYREPALLKQVKLNSKVPTVLFATHRMRLMEANHRITRLVLDGPQGSEGFLRIFPAGMTMTGMEAVDAEGHQVPVDVHPDGRTIRLRYPQQARGLNLTLRWVRPEARLTK
jgi:hypothetical protein